MKISVEHLGKKFNREWIFKNLSYQFEIGIPTAITGGNGSGKSTFLQIVSGFLPSTEGTIKFVKNDQVIPDDKLFEQLDICTPYLELIEEFTLLEFLRFHFKFKKLRTGMKIEDFMFKTYLEESKEKQIKNFSSGMKQRLKLGLAFFSESPICLLDEPTSNLDVSGIDWYHEQVKTILDDKLLIVSSNQRQEFSFCEDQLNIPDFK